jgi:hypothetical protein
MRSARILPGRARRGQGSRGTRPENQPVPGFSRVELGGLVAEPVVLRAGRYRSRFSYPADCLPQKSEGSDNCSSRQASRPDGLQGSSCPGPFGLLRCTGQAPALRETVGGRGRTGCTVRCPCLDVGPGGANLSARRIRPTPRARFRSSGSSGGSRRRSRPARAMRQGTS